MLNTIGIRSLIMDNIKSDLKRGNFNKLRHTTTLNSHKNKLTEYEFNQLESEIECSYEKALELGLACN